MGYRELARPLNDIPITAVLIHEIFHFHQASYAVTGCINPILFMDRLVFPSVLFSPNIKHKIWDTGCKPASWIIFSLQLYYTKLPIFTRLVLSVTGQANPISFEGRSLPGPQPHRIWNTKYMYGIEGVSQPLEWFSYLNSIWCIFHLFLLP